jgi:hypothetical protein
MHQCKTQHRCVQPPRTCAPTKRIHFQAEYSANGNAVVRWLGVIGITSGRHNVVTMQPQLQPRPTHRAISALLVLSAQTCSVSPTAGARARIEKPQVESRRCRVANDAFKQPPNGDQLLWRWGTAPTRTHTGTHTRTGTHHHLAHSHCSDKRTRRRAHHLTRRPSMVRADVRLIFDVSAAVWAAGTHVGEQVVGGLVHGLDVRRHDCVLRQGQDKPGQVKLWLRPSRP